jgi:hypothetical protein
MSAGAFPPSASQRSRSRCATVRGYARRRPTPRGDPEDEDALADDEMLRKFRQLTGVLASERAAAIAAL